MPKYVCYVVTHGKPGIPRLGIYTEWLELAPWVQGYPASYRGCHSMEEANALWERTRPDRSADNNLTAPPTYASPSGPSQWDRATQRNTLNAPSSQKAERGTIAGVPSESSTHTYRRQTSQAGRGDSDYPPAMVDNSRHSPRPRATSTRPRTHATNDSAKDINRGSLDEFGALTGPHTSIRQGGVSSQEPSQATIRPRSMQASGNPKPIQPRAVANKRSARETMERMEGAVSERSNITLSWLKGLSQTPPDIPGLPSSSATAARGITMREDLGSPRRTRQMTRAHTSPEVPPQVTVDTTYSGANVISISSSSDSSVESVQRTSHQRSKSARAAPLRISRSTPEAWVDGGAYNGQGRTNGSSPLWPVQEAPRSAQAIVDTVPNTPTASARRFSALQLEGARSPRQVALPGSTTSRANSLRSLTNSPGATPPPQTPSHHSSASSESLYLTPTCRCKCGHTHAPQSELGEQEATFSDPPYMFGLAGVDPRSPMRKAKKRIASQSSSGVLSTRPTPAMSPEITFNSFSLFDH